MNDSIEHKDREIEKLKRRIAGLEKTLQIVTRFSGRIEKNLKHLFEVISDTMPVPMLITLKTGGILFFNGKAQEIFSYPEEIFYQIKGTDLYENPENRRQFIEILERDGEVRGFGVRLKKADGSTFPASLFSHEIVFEGQNSFLTVIHDLSELKEEEEKRLALERQIRQTQKMEAIGTMAGGIAHDFNNILTIIFGRLDLAMMMLTKDSKARKHIHNALTAAERAKDLISQILAFCRKKEEERKPFCFSTIVSEAVKMIESLIPSNIEVRLVIKSKTVIIMCDPTQIHQVLMNLCSNANYALRDRGGIIEIFIEEVCFSSPNKIMIPNLKPGAYVRLTVSDNGPGMDKWIIERAFDPFFTTKPSGEGTGMGLAVVHGIVQSHGGAVTVESEPGTGAAFHCYFPIVAKTEAVIENSIISNKVIGGRERILLVDDEPDILDTYKEILEHLGYQVISCNASNDALTLFQNQPERFDLVMTDISMPVMSGKTMALEILKIRPDIPILIITGREFKDETLSEITADVVRKPFSQGEISSVIRKLLDKKQEQKDG